MMLSFPMEKVRAVFYRRRLDAELDDEIQAHLEMARDEYLVRGMSPEEATRAARRDFGRIERAKEQHRDVRSVVWVENRFRELKFGARSLRKRPGMAATVVLALSLGIGLPALAFSLIESALLPRLPFENADRIMRVERAGQTPLTDADFAEWSSRQRSFEAVGAFQNARLTLGIAGWATEPISAGFITPSVLPLLAVEPSLGRQFSEDDASQGAPPVVLVSEQIWRERLEADPGVLGTLIRVNGRPAQIVGILPEGFGFPWDQQIWLPLRVDPFRGQRDSDIETSLGVVGLLRDGVSARSAAVELTALTREMDLSNLGETGIGSQVVVRGYTDIFSEPGQSAALAALLLGLTFMVLLVACANVANVMLARAVARKRDVAVRVAIGASRLRIAGELWAEIGLLAAAGGLGGSLIALGATRVIDGVVPPGMPFWVDFRLSPSLLFFVAFVAALAAVMAGLIPALQASRSNTHDLLKDDARGASSYQLGRVMRRLIGVELALSFVLLVWAGLFIRSANNYSQTDFAFGPEGVYTARISLPEEAYAEAADRARYAETLRDALAAIPQVTSAALTTAVPGVGSGGIASIELEDATAAGTTDLLRVQSVAVTPGFFDVFRATLLAGRDFDARDRAGSPPVAIVNAEFAERHFPGGALDQRIRIADPDNSGEWLTIVGVTPDLMAGGLSPSTSEAIYRPVAQVAPPALMIAARSVAGFESLTAPIRESLMGFDPDVPLFSVQAHDVSIDLANAQWKWMSILFLICGATALFLAALGLYGVMSFWVIQRTREIGVRMALGGHRGVIVRLVLRQGMRLTSLGLIAGVLLALPAARLLGGAMFGVSPYDPLVFGSILGVLIAVAWLGCWVPALRATRIDPMRALAAE
jgi:putative ABC transport system permease protein